MKFIHTVLFLCAHIAPVLSGWDLGGDRHLFHRNPALVSRANAVCKTYTIQQGDNCQKLAERYKITVSNIETWNTGSWGWRGCKSVKQGDFVCISSGALPMPVALPQATCGPQVPGTQRPANYADLASLNPCPPDKCCARSGQCGTTPAACDAAQACIFNCGQKKPATSKSKTQAAKPRTTTARRTSTTSKPTAAKTTISKVTTSKKTTTSKASTSKKTTSKAKPTTSATTTKKEVKATKTTETTSKSSPTYWWHMTLYSKRKCEGDYFSLEGYGLSSQGECFSLGSDTSTKIEEGKRSCRWWFNEGTDWSTCSNSTLKQPKSWAVGHGQCYVYKDKKCKDYIGWVAAKPYTHCIKDIDSGHHPIDDWNSMYCWAFSNLPS